MNTQIVMVLAVAAVIATIGLAPAHAFSNSAVEFAQCLHDYSSTVYGQDQSTQNHIAWQYCSGQSFGGSHVLK